MKLKHWVHDEPDSFEMKVDVLYCRRCGRPIRTISDGRELSGAAKPCEFVPIGLRDG